MLVSECVCAYIHVCVCTHMHQYMQACRLKSGEISYMMYKILLALAINQSISVMCKQYIADQCHIIISIIMLVSGSWSVVA